MTEKRALSEDRYFDPEYRETARELYGSIRDVPIVSPHGHVDARLLADEDATFGTPADLFVIPDHYLFRMLYSQGIPLESLGVPRKDGEDVENDHRKIWQAFADNYHLFRATPTGMWLAHELTEVFGIEAKLSGETAQSAYDQIQEKLDSPDFRPRALFKKFNIEVLCTTDAATDTLEHHRAILESDWMGDVRPTFRPDNVTDLTVPGWKDNIERMGEVSGVNIDSYSSFVEALEERRGFFKSMGATATDHGVMTPLTSELSAAKADAVFQKALRGEATDEEAARFTAHTIMESARMSIEDGLTMQFHVGCSRNHNSVVFDKFGPDKGCDIPVKCEFTENMKELLNRYGNDNRLTLIVFTLDESTYARELAPLAGHYPAMLVGPPWWFNDSMNGMKRYREQVTETAGLQNTAGFNDDTRAFPSIPARHDVSRRMDANWIASLVLRGMVDMDDAQEMMLDCTSRLAKKAYKL